MKKANKTIVIKVDKCICDSDKGIVCFRHGGLSLLKQIATPLKKR